LKNSTERIRPLVELCGDGDLLAAVTDYLPDCDLFVDACAGDGHVFHNYRRAKSYWINDPDRFTWRVLSAILNVSRSKFDMPLSRDCELLAILAKDSPQGVVNWDDIVRGSFPDESYKLTNLPLSALARQIVYHGQSSMVFLRVPIEPRKKQSHDFMVESAEVVSAIRMMSLSKQIMWIAAATGSDVDVYLKAHPEAFVYDVGRVEATIWDVRFMNGRRIPPTGDYLVSNVEFIR